MTISSHQYDSNSSISRNTSLENTPVAYVAAHTRIYRTAASSITAHNNSTTISLATKTSTTDQEARNPQEKVDETNAGAVFATEDPVVGADKLNAISWDVNKGRCMMSGLDTEKEVDSNAIDETVDASDNKEDEDKINPSAPAANGSALKVNEQEPAASGEQQGGNAIL